MDFVLHKIAINNPMKKVMTITPSECMSDTEEEACYNRAIQNGKRSEKSEV